MNAFSDTLNTLTTTIKFVSQSNPGGGGGSPVAQTGDIIGMILAIIAAIALITAFAIFINSKRSSSVQSGGSIAKTKSIGICLGIVAAISLLGVLCCYTPLGNAFAQEQVESASSINAYVNEETGEITFDENYIKNNTSKDIVVEASDIEMNEDIATVTGVENLEFTITGMDSVLFKGTLAQPGEGRTPQDPYSNLIDTVGSGQTSKLTYALDKYDKSLALSLIGKEVCFTTLNSVNAVKFAYGVGEGAEGEAPKTQILTNKHNTITIQPLDSEEIVKWGYNATNWKDSAGNTYEPGATATLADDSTNLALSPNWKENANVTITYAAGTGGTVTPTSESVAPATGTAVGSTATADDGYKFDHWKNASDESVSTSATFIPPKNEHDIYETATYTAVFVQDGPVPPVEKYTVSFLTEDVDKGSPSEASAQFPKSTALTYAIDTSGKITFTSGEDTKAVTANAKSGFVFSKWTIITSSTDEADAPESGTITEDVTFKCYFVEDTREATIVYTIVDEDNAHGTLLLDGETEEGYKFTQTVSATAGEDAVKSVTAKPCDPIYFGNRYPYVYYFLNWTLETQDSSTVVSTDMNFKPSKVDGIWTSGTYVAHFATPVAVYTSTNSTMEFFYDEYQHDCTYQYPVNNTQAEGEDGKPVFASWQSENDGTPAVYPRTVKFNESFKNYKGLTSMSYWFWSPWDSDEGEDSGLVRRLPDAPEMAKVIDYAEVVEWTLNEEEDWAVEEAVPEAPAQEVVAVGYQPRVLQSVEGLENVYTQNLAETAYMFASRNSEDSPLASLDFAAWNCPKLTSMQYMFCGCWGLQEINLPTDDEGHYFGANATNMSYMFIDCDNLASIEINGKFGEKATDMSCMFWNCSSLMNFKPAQNSTFGQAVIDLHDMFYGCNNLKEVHLNINFGGNAEIMNGMFYNCNSLNYFNNNASKFGSKVKKMNSMFDSCYSLTAIDLSNFSTPVEYNQADFVNILARCESLKQFKIGQDWNVHMRTACLYETVWFNNNITYDINHIPFKDDGTKVTGEFTRDSEKVVYNIGANSNELKFVYDHNYYTSRIFNVPNYSGFFVGQSQQWYEQGSRPTKAAAKAVVSVDDSWVNDVDCSSAFDLVANAVSNNFGAAGFGMGMQNPFPEWYNFYTSKRNLGIECVLDGIVAVTFDPSFKNFKDLESMSCWFIADSYGKQPFSSFTGWENIDTNNIKSVACMFGGFSNELYANYSEWNVDNGNYVPYSDTPSAQPGNRVYVSNSYQVVGPIADTYGSSITSLDLSSLKFSYDNQYMVLDLSGMFANCVSLQRVTLPTFSDSTKDSSVNAETSWSTNNSNDYINYSYSFSDKYFGGFTGLFYNCRSLTDITNMKKTAQYYMANNYPLSYYKMFFNNKAITEFNMNDVIPLEDTSVAPDSCYLSYIMNSYKGYWEDYNSFAFRDMLRGCDKLEKLYFNKDNDELAHYAMNCYNTLGLHFDYMGLIDDSNPGGESQEGYNPWCPFDGEIRLPWVTTESIPSTLGSGDYPDCYVRDANSGYTVQFKVAPENTGSIIYEYDPEATVANYNFTSYANYSCNGANLTVDGIHYTAVPNTNMHFSYWTLKMGDIERKIYDVTNTSAMNDIIVRDATITAHFAQEGLVAKAVYYEDDDPASELGNRLEFVYDDKEYPDAKYVFEVNPDASATPRLGYTSAPTWYELVYRPNSAFDVIFAAFLPDELKHTVNTDKLGSNYIAYDPDVRSFYSDEWVFKTMVEPKTVIFDDSFKNYNELTSISMWFMADHFGTQTYENFYSKVNGQLVPGFQNLNTESIITANYTFGGLFGTHNGHLNPWAAELKALRSNDSNGYIEGGVKHGSLYGNELDTYGRSIHNLDLTGFKFNNLLDMTGMFANALGLQTIKFPSDLDTSKVVYMDDLFANDESLTSSSQSFENWNKFTTPNVISMGRMFYSCSGLTELDLTNFDTRNVRLEAVFRQYKLPLNEADYEDNRTQALVQGAPEMFFECVRLNTIKIDSKFDKSDPDSVYYPWGKGWTLNMGYCSLPGSEDNLWANTAYSGESFLPYDIPCNFDSGGPLPEQPYSGTFTRQPVNGKKVNFVVPEDMQSYGSLDGKTSEQYDFIETAKIQIPTSDATSALADNTKYNVIPSETGRFAYWTFGDGFSDELRGQIVPDGYIDTFYADDPKYPAGGVTFVANFVSNEKTAKAVFKKSGNDDGTGELKFFFDTVDHSKDEGALAVYPVVPNTSDYNLPAWYRNSMESWTYGDSHPIPKFQTVIEENAPNGIQAVFDDTFADYKELRSMSCWFMSTMSNDEKSIYPGFTNKDQIKMDLGNVPTDCLNNVAYMFGGHEVFNDHMGSKVKGISLSGFDKQQHMKNLNYMFANCIDLEFIDFGYKTDKIKSMKGLFYNCRALNGGNLSKTLQNLVTINVEDMSYMFARYVSYEEKHATELPSGVPTALTFNFPDNFVTINVKNMEGMFSGIATMQTIRITAGPKFITPNLESTAYMFANDYFVEHFYLPATFKNLTNSLSDTRGMFENCRKIESTNYTYTDSEGETHDGGIIVVDSGKNYSINLDYCVNMPNMFSGCTNLKEFKIPRTVQTDIGTGEYITITDASSMFYKCDNLEKVDFASYLFGQSYAEYGDNRTECNVNNMFTTSHGLNDVVSEVTFDNNWNSDLSLYDLGFAKNYHNTNYVTPVVWINTNCAMSLSAHSVPDVKLKSSNYGEGEVVYKRATKTIVIKNDGVMSEVANTNEGYWIERDNSINGYSIGVTDDYFAKFKITSDGEAVFLNILISDKNNEQISVDYQFKDVLKNQSVIFQNPLVPTWKRYLDWSDTKQILDPPTYEDYSDCFETPAGGSEPTICGFMGCFTVADTPQDVVEAAPAVEAQDASQEAAPVQEEMNSVAAETAFEQMINSDVPAVEAVATVLSIFTMPLPWTFFTMFLNILV